MYKLALLAAALLVIIPACLGQKLPESEAQAWLDDYNSTAEQVFTHSVTASWNYNTNLTAHNQQKSVEASGDRAAFRKFAYDNATASFDWRNFQDANKKRRFSKITDIGTASLPPAKVTEVNQLGAKLRQTYSTARVCNRPGDTDTSRCYPLDPDLTNIMANSRDWNELTWAWRGWRDATGKKMKNDYERFVELQNEAARTNQYADAGEYWRSWYEMPNFEERCLELWNTVKPLYQELHSYVLRKLKGRYTSNLGSFPQEGHIPAHLLGNMWSQTWNNILDVVNPYPDKPSVDVTDEMRRQNWNVTHMFRVSEEFFTSLGLIEMPQMFWERSMITKPTDRDVVCHASAWDFYNRQDFRIKQCTEITMNWLITTHHEMGHVQYYLQYKDQPVSYRRGANPGFHEAVGDVLSLSVSTPEHLNIIGLLPNVTDDTETDINFLMSQALKKIAFLPFGFLIDQWRWSVFRGQTKKADYNKKWWELRCKYQGISPPFSRSEEDFDPGAKFHIPNNTPYIRYFISFIIQFQFHKALCEAAGNTRPLHRCDIYRSAAAGTKLADMLKLGSSKIWQDAMEQIAGQRVMDAQPLVDYFQPLIDWLKEQNSAAGSQVGWTDECPDMIVESGAGGLNGQTWMISLLVLSVLGLSGMMSGGTLI